MSRIVTFILFGLLSICAAGLLAGCSDVILFDPKGPIGSTNRFVIIASFALMLIVVIPVFILAIWFPWKYRSSNTKATYDPKWSHSTKIELVVWLVPAAIVTALSIMTWKTTHQLDPHKPIESEISPIRIEAVSLDWKWLFIYPDQQIATVNQIVFPANVPLSFKLTSDTVMTSFFIPQLGSQIYAMAGMETQLHLLASEPGTYTGQNQQLSGEGYADMHFKAIAVSPQEFEAWVETVRRSPEKLDMARYEKLKAPSIRDPVTFFSTAKHGLFEHILGKYHDSMGMKHDGMHSTPKPKQTKPSTSEKS